MPDKLPMNIKNLYQDKYSSESWHTYLSENEKEIHLHIRRGSDGNCTWGVYVNDSGTRKPVLTSRVHHNPDEADLEWFQSRIKLE